MEGVVTGRFSMIHWNILVNFNKEGRRGQGEGGRKRGKAEKEKQEERRRRKVWRGCIGTIGKSWKQKIGV